MEPAHLDKNVAEECAFANPTALEENAVMTDVDMSHVASAPQLKPAQMESVSELPSLNALEESAALIEPEETVEAVLPDKGAEKDSANATTTVWRETVDLQFKPMEPTLDSAPKELVELALLDSPAQKPDSAQPLRTAMSMSELLIV